MELLPVTADYDAVSDRMRQFAATRYMEIIESLRGHVAQALGDPAGIHDIEPGRLQAHTALVKLYGSLIKELGLLYRVQDRPRVDEEESLPLSQVQRLLDEAQARQDQAVAAAAAAAQELAWREASRKQELDLAAARGRVVAGLQALGR